jgi:hypothetical protein
LPFQLAAQPLGQRRASPIGRNRNLQRAAAHDRAIVEVATLRIVDNIAEDPAPLRLAVYLLVHVERRGSGHYQKRRIQIAR